MTTLISPDGREYRTTNVLEIKRLTLGQGYKLKDGEPVADAVYDPGKHTVPEVQVYLSENADRPDEVERVLAAERAGKNRVSLVGDSED